METEGRKLWRVVYPVLTYWGVTLLVSVLFSMGVVTYVVYQNGVSGMLDFEKLMEDALLMLSNYMYEMSIATAVLTLPLMLLYRRWDKKRALRLGKVRRFEKPQPLAYLPVIVLGLASCLLLNNLMNLSGLMGAYDAVAEELSSVLYQGRLVWEILGVGILVPIAEELVFRGVTQSRIEEYWGKKYGIFLSALMFAAIHGNLLQGLYTLPLGLFMGYVYSKYRTLLAPVLFHAAANLLSVTASELGYLNFMADSEPLAWGITVGAAVVVLGCLYVIHDKVWLREFTEESEAPSDGR